MGYTLRIGEFEPKVYEEGLEATISLDAKSERHDSAPAFGEPTDHENSRWPSYTAWHNAMEFCGLDDIFYNKETGLIREHPGCFPLTQKHKEIIDKAHKDFYLKYPNCKAGFSPNLSDKKKVYEDPNWPKENDYAVRLEWLKYWTDWALENCKLPVFYNS